MSKAKLERLLNLTALLVDTPRPLSAQEIHDRMEGYPDDQVAFRQAFERDKKDLRELGIPIAVETVPGTLPAIDGYRIPKDRFYLKDPGLDPEELAALHLAASAVRLEGTAVEEGLAKLGAVARHGEPWPGGANETEGESEAEARSLGSLAGAGLDVTALPARSDLGALFGAVVDRRPVRFTYRGEDRTVDPYRLDFQRGRWYLSGFDHRRDAERVYRLDRIEGDVEVLDAPAFDRPPAVPPAQVNSWQAGEGDPIVARLAVDAEQAPWVVDNLGADVVAEQGADGSIVVELPVTNRDSFRSFALTFLEHAEVLGPPELRDDMVTWLEKLAS